MLKVGAAQFVCKDHRPYSAVKGRGLHDLLTAAMIFGLQYPEAKREDLFEAIPEYDEISLSRGGYRYPRENTRNSQ